MILLILALLILYFIVKAWLLLEPPVKREPTLSNYKLEFEDYK